MESPIEYTAYGSHYTSLPRNTALQAAFSAIDMAGETEAVVIGTDGSIAVAYATDEYCLNGYCHESKVRPWGEEDSLTNGQFIQMFGE
jgi:hypothetical protein